MKCLYNVLKNTSVTYKSEPCYLGGDSLSSDKNVSNEMVNEFNYKSKKLEEKLKNADAEIEAARKSMLETLRFECDDIVENARNECRQMLTQKVKEGFDEGMKIAAKRYEKIEAELEKTKNDVTAQCQKRNDIIEENVLELALMLSRKIIDIQLKKDDESILTALKDTMVRFKEEKNLVVEVSEDVAARLDSEKFAAVYKINANKALSDEEILLNSSYGTVDASIDVQFDNLKNSLLEKCKKL